MTSTTRLHLTTSPCSNLQRTWRPPVSPCFHGNTSPNDDFVISPIESENICLVTQTRAATTTFLSVSHYSSYCYFFKNNVTFSKIINFRRCRIPLKLLYLPGGPKQQHPIDSGTIQKQALTKALTQARPTSSQKQGSTL